MLSIPGNSRIFLYGPPTDMRKSFHGLSTLVFRHLGIPQDGSYYVFINRLRTHVKILYFDGDGLAMWYKRLERGNFVLPVIDGENVELDRRQLSMLLDGIIPLKIKPRFSMKNIRKNSA